MLQLFDLFLWLHAFCVALPTDLGVMILGERTGVPDSRRGNTGKIERDENFLNGNHNSPPLAVVQRNLDAKRAVEATIEFLCNCF